MNFITKQQSQRIQRRLTRLYGERGPALMERFHFLLGRYGVGDDVSSHTSYWNQNDVVLITYADTLKDGERTPLKVLHEFCVEHLKDAISVVHLLPFFPWSSDDGFSVIDYRQVDPGNGGWADVTSLGQDFDLMFDLVLNHCSRESSWFREFVTGAAPSRFYFHSMDPEEDLSAVVRPRPWPLLTEVNTRDGKAHVWTTFSEDQVDLNWRNPDVLFEFLDILFLYLTKGCRIFRLDAVAFLWKKVGTNCIHLPETHEVVRLFRDVLDVVAPDAVLLTETNVPHMENISYFGKANEAHMVYNFSLPPLTLHALLRGDSTHLREWAVSLPDLPHGQTFLNFTASHDGIGVRPLQGILEDRELKWVVKQVTERGGRVSTRTLPDGSQAPYELNITYRDALKVRDEPELSMARFLCSQAIMLAFKGMPAVYIQSLLGTENWEEGVAETGQNRTINRRKWELAELNAVLKDPDSESGRIFAQYSRWLRRRRGHPAFQPGGGQSILDLGKEVFGFVRESPARQERIVCVFNLTPKRKSVPVEALDPALVGAKRCRDLLSGKDVEFGNQGTRINLKPYYAYWLAPVLA